MIFIDLIQKKILETKHDKVPMEICYDEKGLFVKAKPIYEELVKLMTVNNNVYWVVNPNNSVIRRYLLKDQVKWYTKAEYKKWYLNKRENETRNN